MEAHKMVVGVDLLKLRAARERLWYGKATVETVQSVKDPITKRAVQSYAPVVGLEDIPCKLSHKKKDANQQLTSGPSTIEHSTWISTGNEHQIPPGSRITVTQNGKTLVYKNSGEPAYFLVHQEIPLIPDKEYA